MALATPEDVAARLGRELTEVEHAQVAVLLDDAERILRARIPDLLTKVETGELDRGLVVMIEATMVLRVIRNPEGLTSETDGSYSYEVSTEVASGRLSVLEREWAWLGLRSGAYVITPYLAPVRSPRSCLWEAW